ncbi:type IV pilus biogenesis protein PilM [Tenuibacillus multivorans]|uniref:Type IV pilus assembly protein PilM n=1 Tax=Tenuibacillus multivorans TaxID=237069 RepID=A0A1H0FZG2_9BACI|nr:pilus assembly protein PilM [Tenuibacillus multivorans]GEL78147.1 hypothetical protein TMU01_23820 [Tenuibacillus multivorans]SDN99961.1 type IV pilus assembly protein PilM [Tenuibacillus multivorans]
MSQNIVNLEIHDYVIRYIETAQSNAAEIIGFGEYFIPNDVIKGGTIEKPEAFQKILQTLAKKWRLKRKHVRLTMPDSLVIIRKQNIPKSIQKRDIDYYVNFQLGESIHLPFYKPIFETILLNEGEEHYEISLISTCETLVQPYIDQFKKLKCKVIAVDISPLNYYRLFYHQKELLTEDQTLLIQYNATEVVFSAFEQHVPIFLQQFHLRLPEDEPLTFGDTMTKEDFNQDDVLLDYDEIRTEIERIERFYKYSMNHGERSFTKTIIAGDHPYLSDIIEKMSNRSKTEMMNLTDEDLNGLEKNNLERKYHNVIGLAMKEGR